MQHGSKWEICQPTRFNFLDFPKIFQPAISWAGRNQHLINILLFNNGGPIGVNQFTNLEGDPRALQVNPWDPLGSPGHPHAAAKQAVPLVGLRGRGVEMQWILPETGLDGKHGDLLSVKNTSGFDQEEK